MASHCSSSLPDVTGLQSAWNRSWKVFKHYLMGGGEGLESSLIAGISQNFIVLKVVKSDWLCKGTQMWDFRSHKMAADHRQPPPSVKCISPAAVRVNWFLMDLLFSRLENYIYFFFWAVEHNLCEILRFWNHNRTSSDSKCFTWNGELSNHRWYDIQLAFSSDALWNPVIVQTTCRPDH